jgi:hypothetical protein
VLADVEAEAHEPDGLPKAQIDAAQTVRPCADQEVYALNLERLEVAAQKERNGAVDRRRFAHNLRL